MTIVVPNTFDGLVKLSKAVSDNLSDLGDLGHFNITRLVDRTNNLIVEAKDYLNEKPDSSRNNVFAELKRFTETPAVDFEILDSYLVEGETGEDLRDGVIALAQAALNIRAPLGENKLARFALDKITSLVGKNLGSVWKDSSNPVGKLSVCYGILNGDEISFVSLKSGINAVDDYVRGITGFSGPSTGPSDEQICENFGMITGFAREIMKQAEARLPQPPVRAEPARKPIFEKAAPAA